VHKKIIYLIRHGQTDYNLKGIVQGSGIDAPLNERGLWQAQMFYEAYKNIPFSKIYTSTLLRTHQTAGPFIQKNIDWQQHYGFNEINWGQREGRIPDTNDTEEFNYITEQWRQGQHHLAFDSGESPQQVAQRQQIAMQIVLANKQEHNVLIAMHGRALKILLAHIIHKDLSQMDTFDHSNLCLYLLEYDYNTQVYEIIKQNDTSHLLGHQL
jgi:broad specificity phosphatase PhoE